jgi:hypothetical protein
VQAPGSHRQVAARPPAISRWHESLGLEPSRSSEEREPGAALPVSSFEHGYAAQLTFASGAYDQAIAIASEGLVDHPDNGGLRYQLVCYCAMGGRGDEAVEHLR